MRYRNVFFDVIGVCSTNGGIKKRTRKKTRSATCGGRCAVIAESQRCTPASISCQVSCFLFLRHENVSNTKLQSNLAHASYFAHIYIFFFTIHSFSTACGLSFIKILRLDAT